jgi:hypothetical protein
VTLLKEQIMAGQETTRGKVWYVGGGPKNGTLSEDDILPAPHVTRLQFHNAVPAGEYASDLRHWPDVDGRYRMRWIGPI